jgi:integrase
MSDRPESAATTTKARRSRIDPARCLNLEELTTLKAWAVANAKYEGETIGKRASLVVQRAYIVLGLLGTGARRFELCALQCGDVFSGPNGPMVRFNVTKGDKPATIPISQETWEALQAWIAFKKDKLGEAVGEDAPLFCGRAGGYMSQGALHLHWKIALEAAGINTKYGVHASRHAAGMLLLRATNSLSVVSEFLRHDSERTTEKFYKHLLGADIRNGLTAAGL